MSRNPEYQYILLIQVEKLTYYEPDKLIENKIITELKAKVFLPKQEMRRAVEYLSISEYEILYVVNFKDEVFQPKRYVFSNARKKFIYKK